MYVDAQIPYFKFAHSLYPSEQGGKKEEPEKRKRIERED